MVIKIKAKIAKAVKKFISPELICPTVPEIALGIPETIPAKMIKEIPFPIPLCVICSPSHIKSIVPASIEIAQSAINIFKSSTIIAPAPPRPCKLCKPIATPILCTKVITIVA